MSQPKHYTGSLSELIKLSFPLMLTWISTTIMMFVDRLFLSHYSLHALGAAVNAGTIAWGFTYGFQIMTEMSQVVVAQYRGAGKEQKLSHPVWQMLWIVLLSLLLFVPIAIFASKWFFAPGTEQHTYFTWIVLFGPAFGLIGAGSAYFMGRGENRIVTYWALAGNGINLVLDYIMIFGVQGIVPEMGVKGAAIATGIGMSVQGLGLLLLFLKRTNYKIIPLTYSELKPCLRTGLPPGIFMGAELVGWGLFFTLMAKAGPTHLTVTSVCHSLIPLLACVGIGLQKATSTMSGTMIGAGRLDDIAKVVRSGFVILSAYITLLTSIMYLFPNYIFLLFQNRALDPNLYQLLQYGFLLASVYLFFGGIRCLATGVLSAAGDAKFLMIAGSSSVWVFLLAPTYYAVIAHQASVTAAQAILAGYGLCVALIYFARYKRGRWTTHSKLVGGTS
ncbi:MAG: MATE family efflux transporter [Simkaniaceae bacterium]|nr:MATE family efflux transporter [Simkaniaceae bacterium]